MWAIPGDENSPEIPGETRIRKKMLGWRSALWVTKVKFTQELSPFIDGKLWLILTNNRLT
jgi:hypothetical protein